jgi:hypothetical protein
MDLSLELILTRFMDTYERVCVCLREISYGCLCLQAHSSCLPVWVHSSDCPQVFLISVTDLSIS